MHSTKRDHPSHCSVFVPDSLPCAITAPSDLERRVERLESETTGDGERPPELTKEEKEELAAVSQPPEISRSRSTRQCRWDHSLCSQRSPSSLHIESDRRRHTGGCPALATDLSLWLIPPNPSISLKTTMNIPTRNKSHIRPTYIGFPRHATGALAVIGSSQVGRLSVFCASE